MGSACSPRDSQESSLTPQFKSINSSVLSFLYSLTLSSIHDYWKTIALTRQIFVGKVMSLLFNMLSRLVITFLPRSKTFVGKVMSLLFNMLSRLVIAFHSFFFLLPRSKRLLISWLQSPSAVILKPKKIKSATVSIVSPSICHEVMGPDAMILVF